MCNSVNCSLAGILVSVLVGIAVGFLFFFGFLPTIATAVIAALILAVLLLVFTLWLSTKRTGRSDDKCLCQNLRALLLAVLGTLALGILSLAVALVSGSVVLAILIGLGAAFASGMLLQLFCLVRCLTKDSCDSYCNE